MRTNMNTLFNNKIIKGLVLLLIVAWYALLLIRPVEIASGDLGRHLKNGEIILDIIEGADKKAIFSSNFYSYTHPDHPFVNHHWGSGLIFYIIYQSFGFLGLQTFFILLSITTLAIFFRISQKESNFWIAASYLIFLMPLLAERRQIRPETFSYLFLAIYIFILLKYKNSKQRRLLYALPPIMLLWVNTHIFFVFGFFLIVVFLLESIWQKETVNKKNFLITLFAAGVASLFNPLRLQTIFYPFKIFNNLGLKIKETLSIKEAAGTVVPMDRIFVFVFSLVLFYIILFILLKKKNFSKIKPRLMLVLITTIFALLAYKMIRNLTLYALFVLPILSYLSYGLIETYKNKFNKEKMALYLFAFFLLVTIFVNKTRIPNAIEGLGYNLPEGSQAAGEFVAENNIKGPLFNDFDSGSYVIYHLYPRLKPFVDNRPEAYPSQFFRDTYIPLRNDIKMWKETDAEYNFNVVLLSLKDKSRPNARFVGYFLDNKDWTTIFANDKHIVFVKNNEGNKSIIEKFSLDKYESE